MNKKIMIVDDDRLNLTLLQFGLKEKGYQICVAHDGKEALDVLARERPDLIILDIQMPNMNGYEFMNHINGAPEFKVPVVMLTANETMQDVFFMEGVRGYLVKPVNMKILEEKIAACLK
ncbi:MAG: response regulator [Candidatus Omnitrophica bacterium]|nr:response regulator [Candidatus Omnitrophota bacterium]